VEITGVATGFPYGQFSYSADLGPRIFGLVPYLLPVSWVPLVLGAVAATERRSGAGALRVTGWTLSAAVLLTALDGVLDPGAAKLGFWEWSQGGPYYGVPLSNYRGWLLSSLLASALLIAVLPWKTTTPAPGMLDSTFIALAFWTSVALFTGLVIPVVLGTILFTGLLARRVALQRHATSATRVTPPGRAGSPYGASGAEKVH
ncbi:MAG: carotenoid biosynthesis protein, partial [Chloroflexota bacterium]|nr:carotenoid biosynthesis protein [Chloroflexota bacterium]